MRPAPVRLLFTLVLVAMASIVAACGDANDPTKPAPTPSTFITPTGLESTIPPELFVGAGDIADCGKINDEATATVLDNIPGTVFVLGDNVYENGTDAEYQNCYHPNWGRHKARTKPSAGNHEYNTSGATGYYNYFGAAAGDPTKGYYSYELGAWHVIVLNSNVSMRVGSAQETWLKADLAAHPNLCTAAYWHHPLYSSTGGTGSGGLTYSSVRPLVEALYQGGADLMLGGHRHFYERMTPMKPDGTADPDFGIRQIIAGTGGKSGGEVTNVFPRSEVRNGNTFGVLKLYLYEDSYAWRFAPIAGKTFSDTGSTACHGAPGAPPPSGGVSASLSTVSVFPATITAGTEAAIITVTARNAAGAPVSGANVVLSATGSRNTLIQPGAATDVNGVATGSLSSSVAQGKTVSAIINGVAITQTANVTVVPAAPAVLTFLNQPSSSTPGTTLTPPLQVEISDEFENRVTSATNSVSIAIGTNPGGGTLSGTTTATPVSGVVTFGDLSIDQLGNGYTLTTSGDGLTGATSNAFNISDPGVSQITHTLLAAGNDPLNVKVYTTAPIAPAPNTLITIAVMGHRSSGATASPVITGAGMTWQEVASETFDPLGLPLKRVTVYRAMSASPGSGPLTITFASNVSNAQWIVSQWDGVETTGTNGADAIGQVASVRADAVSGLTVPLGAFSHPNNVGYGVFGVRSSVAVVSPGAGFAEISEQPSAEGTPATLQAQWARGIEAIVASWTNLQGAALGIEIKARTTP